MKTRKYVLSLAQLAREREKKERPGCCWCSFVMRLVAVEEVGEKTREFGEEVVVEVGKFEKRVGGQRRRAKRGQISEKPLSGIDCWDGNGPR